MADKPTILYVAMRYDYGKPENGFGFEHYNFFDSLHNLGYDILYFDPVDLKQKYGKPYVQKRLLETVQKHHPALMFVVLFTDELDYETVGSISEETNTTTLNWFCDDHWRFDDYSCHWAPHFNWVATTANSAVPKYEAMGYKSAIKTQWAANTFRYKRMPGELKWDVTFVGRPHGNRVQVIEAIEAEGLPVDRWGEGWPAGPADHKWMLEVFSRSRINLNLSNTSAAQDAQVLSSRIERKLQAWAQAGGWKASASKLLSAIPGTREKKSPDPIAAPAGQLSQQIKGRNFEVPACGGLLMTTPADDLHNYFAIDEEVVLAESLPELIEKTRYYLGHEEERAKVAAAGYERVQREHTYRHRYRQLFETVWPEGLAQLDEPDEPGRVLNIE